MRIARMMYCTLLFAFTGVYMRMEASGDQSMKTTLPMIHTKAILQEPAGPAVPPFPTPTPTPYGPKMYLRVSWAKSHLFPGQLLGCTGVIALCARVPPCVQPVADWTQSANTLFKSLVHSFIMTQWPKCSLKCVSWFLFHHFEQTNTKFNSSLAPGEGLRADTVSRVSVKSQKTAVCLIFILTHFFCTFWQ